MSEFLILLGSIFCLFGSIGVYRFNSLLPKLHAASISSSLGLPIMLIGAAISLGTYTGGLKAVTGIIFLFVTGPIVGHLLGRVGRNRG